jgi:hypothetical protein
LNVANYETGHLQIAQPFSEDRVTNSFDAPTKFSESQGSIGQRAENYPAPPFPKESKRPNQRLVARRRLSGARIIRLSLL